MNIEIRNGRVIDPLRHDQNNLHCSSCRIVGVGAPAGFEATETIDARAKSSAPVLSISRPSQSIEAELVAAVGGVTSVVPDADPPLDEPELRTLVHRARKSAKRVYPLGASPASKANADGNGWPEEGRASPSAGQGAGGRYAR